MARSLRLIALWLLLLPVVSWASIPAQHQSGYTVTANGHQFGPGDLGAMCTAAVSSLPASDCGGGETHALTPVVVSGGCHTRTQVCSWFPCSGDGCISEHALGVAVIDEMQCPSNSVPNSAGTCDCSPGNKESPDHTSCVSACGPAGASNGSLGGGSYSVTGNLNTLCAPDGCVVQGAVTAHDGNGQFAIGPFSNTGESCSGATAGGNTPSTPAQAPGQSTCSGTNMCGGTFNGAFICSKCTDAEQTPLPGSSQSTSTSASGVTTSTTSTTSTHTTDNPNGTSTTTTTVLNGDGSSSTSSSTCKTGTKGCPSALEPDQKGSFGGSCGSSFSCDGDAVQCAIAKEQHERDCQLFDPAAGSGPWADAANRLTTAINDGIQPTWSPAHPSNVVTTNFDWSTTINQTPTLSAGCPNDVAIGSSGLVLSFSALCPYLGVLGNFIVAFTSIACAFILFKGMK